MKGIYFHYHFSVLMKKLETTYFESLLSILIPKKEFSVFHCLFSHLYTWANHYGLWLKPRVLGK